MLARALVVVGLLASHAAAEKRVDPACGPPAKKKTLRTMRDVDWCNFDFGFWKGPLREGRSSVHLYADLGEPHDTIAASLRGVIYGDFDGDKRLDAAIVIESATWIGRTGAHSGSTTVYLYTLAKGRPTGLGSVPAGTPVDDITLGKGIVTVTSGPANGKATLRYRRVKGEFVEVKPSN